ncbi:MAG: AmmeMemoRadiSam system protein A [Desulfobulbaceae bacterium]|nr:AmmeMemoRadiSam system protein A [Desulfobulbaceae bacterium]
MLNREQARALLAFARQEIVHALHAPKGTTHPDLLPDDPVFREKRAVFVTLSKRQALRGCIGSLVAVESLAESVRRNAVNAALHDPRFPPLTLEELKSVHIEISVLGVPQPLPYSDTEHLLTQLEPGRDGLILQGPGGARATFLPQVWRQLPAAADFLSALCRKAGLAADAWKKGGMSYQRYRVESFEEEGGGQ